jgi:hypothetical protein
MDMDGFDAADYDFSDDVCPFTALSWTDVRRLQDAELEESLKADREADVRRMEVLKIEEAERERVRESQSMHHQDLSSKRLRLGSEPSNEELLIAVRFPSGKRAGRNFLRTDPVASLYDFVQTEESVGDTFALVEASRHAVLRDLGASLQSSGLRTRTTLQVVRDP